MKNFIGAIIWALSILCIFSLFFILNPSGVDWKFYSYFSVDYNSFYYLRELVGWVIIDTLNDFNNSNILISTVILELLFIGTFALLRAISCTVIIALLISTMLALSNFYLLMSVNGLRQGIAVSFLILALLLKYSHSKFSLLLFILSVLSHNSSIVFFPLFLVGKINPVWFYLISIAQLPLGGYIVEVAAKNDNASPTSNGSIFLILNIAIISFATVHHFIQRFEVKRKAIERKVYLSLVFLFCLGTAFYQNSAVYERLVYTSIPLSIVFVSFYFSSYRPDMAKHLILSSLVIMSILFSFFHPSVRENFEYLRGY